MTSICRVCLIPADSLDTNVMEYIETIENLVQIEFDRNPDLPQLVCNECQRKLSIVKEIFKLCVNSYEFFLNYIPSHKKKLDAAPEDTEYVNLEMLDEVLYEPKEIKRETFFDENLIEMKLITEDADTGQTIQTSNVNIVKHERKSKMKQVIFCKTPKKKESRKEKEPQYKKKSPINHFYCCKCPQFVFSSEQAEYHFLNKHAECERHQMKNESKYNCKFCLKHFNTIHEMKNHQVIKKSDSTSILFTCSLCQQSELTLTEYRVHGEKEHGSEATYNCDLCSLSYTHFSSFSSHVYVKHLNEQNNVCSECGKSYARKSYLESHYRVDHQGRRDFQCMQCKATFKRAHSLKCHMRVHTGEKPYKCTNCSKAYSHHTDLKAHIAYRHTGIFKHNCTVCDRGFLKPSQLKLHMQKHGSITDVKMDVGEV